MRRLAAITVAMLAAAAWATTAAAEIRIGVAGPMTGAQAWFGEQFERGAGMAAADLNAKGGILGQQVEVVVSDDFCDPDQALKAAILRKPLRIERLNPPCDHLRDRR